MERVTDLTVQVQDRAEVFEESGMAKTVAEKLFIKPGYRVGVLNAPDTSLVEALADLPNDATVSQHLGGQFDLIVYYAPTQAVLLPKVDKLKAALKSGGYLWIAYPKGGDKAKVKTDLNRDLLWKVVADYQLTPVHQIALDDTWSALRFKTTS